MLEIDTQLVSDSCPTKPEDEPTLFSQARFVNTIVQAMRNSCRAVELRSETSQSSMFGVESLHSHGRRSVSLAPYGLYAHPAGDGDLDTAVRDIIGQLKGYSTTTFQWNVRFDHAALAQALVSR